MNTSTPTTPSSAASTPTLSAVDQATKKIADSLVEMCTAGKGTDAMQKLYADDARHVEAMEMPGHARITEGKAALIARSEKFDKSTTIHSKSCGPALVNGDQFTCLMSMDSTSNEGPMAGKRMQTSETCLYTVANGKIAEGKFFYNASGK